MLAIVGAGAMGTALAVHLARAGRPARILATAFDGPIVDAHRAGDPHPVLGVPFPPGATIHAPEEWGEPLVSSEMVVLAVATAGLAATVREVAPAARADALWVVATKGWDDETGRSSGRVVAEEVGDPARTVVLVGPSLAGEIAAGVPTAVVCASADLGAARRVAEVFRTPGFRTYVSDEVAGVEVGAALKNVIAIAVGMCDGLAGVLGLPALTNTKAFLFSRGLVEMVRLAGPLGGKAETVLGLTGAGDLFVTCLGGRNARFGALIGAGASPEAALNEMRTTVEGYANARAASMLAERYSLDLPVVRAVARVLYDGLSPREAIESLVDGEVEQEMR